MENYEYHQERGKMPRTIRWEQFHCQLDRSGLHRFIVSRAWRWPFLRKWPYKGFHQTSKSPIFLTYPLFFCPRLSQNMVSPRFFQIFLFIWKIWMTTMLPTATTPGYKCGVLATKSNASTPIENNWSKKASHSMPAHPIDPFLFELCCFTSPHFEKFWPGIFLLTTTTIQSTLRSLTTLRDYRRWPQFLPKISPWFFGILAVLESSPKQPKLPPFGEAGKEEKKGKTRFLGKKTKILQLRKAKIRGERLHFFCKIPP